MMLRRRLSLVLLGGLALGLALEGCAPKPSPPPAAGNLGNGGYKLGQPYQVNGTWYYPSDDFGYDETGIASWYGPGFDEKFTANGEVFDQNAVSGAHKTLAMPTIVQVTNLDNGRSIQLRVNDRGPYIGSRVLDVSKHAAELLGFDQSGTAKVRVKVLVPETMQAQSLAKHIGSDVAADDTPAPPAVPHGAVGVETLAPLGSSAPSEPVPGPTAKPPMQLASLPPPAATPPAVTVVQVKSSHIFIQAGAFSNGANAMKMKAKLEPLGPVVVAGARINGMDIYRVRLGPIATVDEADQLLTRAVGAGANDAKIVVD